MAAVGTAPSVPAASDLVREVLLGAAPRELPPAVASALASIEGLRRTA